MDRQDLLKLLTSIYKNYPKNKILKYFKHLPFYFLLFIHIYFLDKLMKSIDYNFWIKLKNIFTFKVKKRLFFDEDFWFTIPPYTDLFFYKAYIHTPGEYKLTKFIIRNFFDKKIIFFDVGANFGYYSVLLSKISPESSIFAFEPNPYALEILNLNKRKNINIIPKAVGSHSGKIKFEKGHYMNSLSTNVFLGNKLNEKDIIEVDIISLDDFCRETKVVPNFIKIDVEKIELDVLKGGEDIIANYGPLISLEFYYDEKINYYIECFNFLKKYNYRAYFINLDGDLIFIEDIKDLINLAKKHQLLFDNLVFSK